MRMGTRATKLSLLWGETVMSGRWGGSSILAKEEDAHPNGVTHRKLRGLEFLCVFFWVRQRKSLMRFATRDFSHSISRRLLWMDLIDGCSLS